MEQPQTVVIQQKKNNTIPILLLGLTLVLLGVGLYIHFTSKSEIEKLIIQHNKEIKSTRDSLSAVRDEANILAFENDSLVTKIKRDSVRTVYITGKTKIIYKTNENTAALYNSPTDSAKISLWSRILTDSTYTKGSGASSKRK